MIELTERDEFAFHEMMAHLPLFSHRNPKHVLIVGGGDGVCLREVCRHKDVERVTLVEIDPMVIQASKEHLNIVPKDLFENDPRVEIVIADAAEYLKDKANLNKFDVILADTLDPIGPAESLFEPEFYETMHAVLRDSGIICIQGESFFIHLQLIRDLVSVCKDIFDYAEYATTFAPSYPCGQIGFVIARKGETKSCKTPMRPCTFQSDLKWYNHQMHRAAFVLPQYIQEELSALDHGLNNDDRDDEENDDFDKCFFSDCVIL
jgi:spermidine synthase